MNKVDNKYTTQVLAEYQESYTREQDPIPRGLVNQALEELLSKRNQSAMALPGILGVAVVGTALFLAGVSIAWFGLGLGTIAIVLGIAASIFAFSAVASLLPAAVLIKSQISILLKERNFTRYIGNRRHFDYNVETKQGSLPSKNMPSISCLEKNAPQALEAILKDVERDCVIDVTSSFGDFSMASQNSVQDKKAYLKKAYHALVTQPLRLNKNLSLDQLSKIDEIRGNLAKKIGKVDEISDEDWESFVRDGISGALNLMELKGQFFAIGHLHQGICAYFTVQNTRELDNGGIASVKTVSSLNIRVNPESSEIKTTILGQLNSFESGKLTVHYNTLCEQTVDIKKRSVTLKYSLPETRNDIPTRLLRWIFRY